MTCIAISRDGTTLASGQITHMGYLAQIILWDISQIGNGQPKLLHTLKLHKVQIQALAFSCNGRCGKRPLTPTAPGRCRSLATLT